MAKRIPDHKAHLSLAVAFRAARARFDDFANTIWRRFPKAHRISRQIDKLNNQMGELQHQLDCEYHRVTMEGEFNKAGHVYYMDPEKTLIRDLSDWIFPLEYANPRFREPEKGELFIGIYREVGRVRPILLWVDPSVDLYYDVGQREHVKPPSYYLRIDAQGQAAANLGVTQLTFEGIA